MLNRVFLSLRSDQNLQQRIERTNDQSRSKKEETKERVNKQIGIMDKKETEEPESQTLNRPTFDMDDAENATRQPHRQGNTKLKTQAEKADQKALKSINQMQHKRLAMSLNDRQKNAGTQRMATEAESVRQN